MPDLDAIVAAVASAKKYRWLCEDTIRRVAERELGRAAGGDTKVAIKATKRRLHQVYGAFEQAPMRAPTGGKGTHKGWGAPTGGCPYDRVWQWLEAAYASRSPREIEAACRQALELHRSTHERLPILERFYPSLWAVTGRPRSLLDLGCGLNPLALPWMDLEPGCRYVAIDIDRRRVDFLNRFLSLAGLEPLARCQDLLVHPPQDAADVALLLKMSPGLERQEPGATEWLIDRLAVPFVVVSFAGKSLGGRDKGMIEHYQQQFLALAARRAWPVTEVPFDAELAFVLARSPQAEG